MKNLLKTTGFISFLSVVFFNAFVDLGHKIVIQNTVFKVYDGQVQVALTAFLNALILLPFVLLFTPTGFISDKFSKPKVMAVNALFDVINTSFITLFYYKGLYYEAFFMTFLTAIQSAFFSPAKFGYIKEIAGVKHISEGNALVQAVTIIAILTGVFLFSILFEMMLSTKEYGGEADILVIIAPLGWILVVVSVLEAVLAWRLPQKLTPGKTPKFKFNKYLKGVYLAGNLNLIKENRIILFAIIALSVFWSVSQVILAAFPAHGKENLNIINTVVIQGILASSGVGIALGAYIAGIVSAGRIERKLIPLGSVGVFVSLTLVLVTDSPPVLAVLFILTGMFGSFMIVPLNSLIQFHAKEGKLGMTLAGNNWVQNIGMLGFLILTIAVAYSGLNSIMILVLVTLLSFVLAVFAIRFELKNILYSSAELLLTSFYRVQTAGKIPPSSGVLILANHVSYLDWAAIEYASPRRVHFVIDEKYHANPYLNWFIRHFGTIPINKKTSRGALFQINKYLTAGKVVCLFPEGGISYSGHIGAIKKGYEKAAANTEAQIIPCYIHGLWGSRFSRVNAYYRKQSRKLYKKYRRRVVVSFGKPLPADTQAGTVKRKISSASSLAWQENIGAADTIPGAWLKMVKRNKRLPALADSSGIKLNHARAFSTAWMYAGHIRRRSGQNIGVILPPSSIGALINMAVIISGKKLINLNYAQPAGKLRRAIIRAEISWVYTTRKFINKLSKNGDDLENMLESMAANIRVCYLEDVVDNFTRAQKFMVFAAVYLVPEIILKKLFISRQKGRDTASIGFFDGNKGTFAPTQHNIVCNCLQIYHLLQPPENGLIMGTLPFSDGMGLILTGIMPLLTGIPVIYHPDPTDNYGIACTIKKYKAYLWCASTTLIKMMTENQTITPAMLTSLRHIIINERKLDRKIQDDFSGKFTLTPLAAYGIDGAAPIISINFLGFNRKEHAISPTGVSIPLPGTVLRIVDPVTLAEFAENKPGLILASGPQVIQKFVDNPAKTSENFCSIDDLRWYKTGDTGCLDQDGFLIR